MSQKTASDSLSVSVLVSMCVCVSLVIMLSLLLSVYVTVTVTEALVLRLLLEDRGRITESIRILVPVDRMKQKCFQVTTNRVRRSQQF